MKMTCFALLIIAGLFAATPCLAKHKDAANCKDHPLINRLPDYWIESCTLKGNMKLSQDRAQSVVQALVKTHGIEASRLKTYGSGSYAPVASNDSEKGRAKNRRVELVKQ